MTPQDRLAIYERDGGICGFCQEHVEWEDLDIDHIRPRALGGPTTMTNLRAAHAICNRSAATEVHRLKSGRSETYVRLYVNIAADLSRRIRELAQRERRTVNGQIEVVLEHGLAATSTKEAVSC